MTEATTCCLHCLTPVANGGGDFCCTGCSMVYALLRTNGLDRFYELRGKDGWPVTGSQSERRDLRWLEPLEEMLRREAGVGSVVLDIQGLHCAACVWLIETMFLRYAGAHRIVVNPTLGRVNIVADARFELRRFIEDIERFG